MWMAALPAILQARKQGSLGALNPLPFVSQVLNCIGWTMYGCMTRDYFIFWSNGTGMTLGFFYCMTSMTLLAKSRQDESLPYVVSEYFLVLGIFFWAIVAFLAAIVFEASPAIGLNIVGGISAGLSLAYYIVPLSSIVKICKERDSSSLYGPMLCANLANSLLWFIYGFFALNAAFVWAPNLIGMLFAFSQLSVLLFIPAKSARSILGDTDTQNSRSLNTTSSSLLS